MHNTRPAADLITPLQRAKLKRFIEGVVEAVEDRLENEDVAGANEICDELLALGQQGVHDVVLSVIGARRGLPHWRTFG